MRTRIHFHNFYFHINALMRSAVAFDVNTDMNMNTVSTKLHLCFLNLCLFRAHRWNRWRVLKVLSDLDSSFLFNFHLYLLFNQPVNILISVFIIFFNLKKTNTLLWVSQLLSLAVTLFTFPVWLKVCSRLQHVKFLDNNVMIWWYTNKITNKNTKTDLDTAVCLCCLLLGLCSPSQTRLQY